MKKIITIIALLSALYSHGQTQVTTVNYPPAIPISNCNPLDYQKIVLEKDLRPNFLITFYDDFQFRELASPCSYKKNNIKSKPGSSTSPTPVEKRVQVSKNFQVSGILKFDLIITSRVAIINQKVKVGIIYSDHLVGPTGLKQMYPQYMGLYMSITPKGIVNLDECNYGDQWQYVKSYALPDEILAKNQWVVEIKKADGRRASILFSKAIDNGR